MTDPDPVPKSVTLDRESSDIVWKQAKESYDGNFSLALRKIVKDWKISGGQDRPPLTGWFCDDCHQLLTSEKHALHNRDHTLRRVLWNFENTH